MPWAVGRQRAFGIRNHFGGALNVLAPRAMAGWIYPKLARQIDPAGTLETIDRRFAPDAFGGRLLDFLLNRSRAVAMPSRQGGRTIWADIVSGMIRMPRCHSRIAGPFLGHGPLKIGCYSGGRWLTYTSVDHGI